MARQAQHPPLRPEELRLIEALVARGALLGVAAGRNAKPRKITAASVTEGGRRVLLYLSPTIEPETDT